MSDTNTQIADAGAAGWIGLSVAAIMAGAFLCGFVGPKSLLLMACISLACWVAYMGAAITQLKLGNAAGGITWLYFGAFFAFGAALNYAVSYFAPIYHWDLDPKIIGIEWAIITVILVLTTPLFVKYAPAAGSIAIIAADVGLAALALIYLGFASPFMFQLSGWALIITGVLAIIMGAGGILTSAGMAFPLMGKPLIKS